MTQQDEQKAYEERLRHRLEILRKTFEEGNISIPNDPHIVESIMAVKYGPDGEIDLETANSTVRSLALAVTVMHDREELKKAFPLNEIQDTYFKFIERNFGHYHKIMVDRGLTPHDAGLALSRKEETINSITSTIPEFVDVIVRFWEEVGEAASIHIEDMHDSLKGIFGGDLFPSHSENIASKCGIYTDTIVLPDPFLRSKDLFKLWPKENQAYYFIKHAMNLLQYKKLACEDIEKPIVVILPDRGALEEQEREFLTNLGQKDSLEHAAKIFHRNFTSFDELMEFAYTLDSIEKVVAELKDKTRVLFDTEWDGDISEQIKEAMEGQSGQLLGTNHPGVIVATTALGRMTASNEILIKARRLHATPIIDAPTSWIYFNWKLEYDAGKAEEESGEKNLHILRGLQSLSQTEMQWLGKVPIAALIEIRKSGALDEIRSILGTGVEEIARANPTNFHRTTDQVFENIDHAFELHKEKIKELSQKKWKFAGSDVASWLVVGSLEIAAAATGLPVWGLASIAANQVLDMPKLKDIPASIKELAEENQKLKLSPVGMLFKYSQK